MTALFHSSPSLREERLPGGAHTSLILRKGQILRLTDIDGGANVSMMMLNPHEKSERLNLPDTLKGQHTARLTAGHCFYSDMGRVLAGIVADSCGWHDPFGGCSTPTRRVKNMAQDATRSCATASIRNGVDNLLVEMGKWDLGLEDLLMVVNFFSKVTVDEDGRFQFISANSRAGDYVELFAPMDVLMVLTALPHPQDPAAEYAPRPIQLSWYQADDAQAAAEALFTRDENQRAFLNTQLFAL
jgi:urea carboxylase-associated protein 2